MRSLLNALQDQVDDSRVALKLCFGLVPLLAGLDKFFNLLADWPHYLSPLATSLLPVSATTAMHVIGVVEIAVGIAVLSPWTVIGSLVAAGWLIAIALNLVDAGFYDIAVRDAVLAVAAYTLASLTAQHETVAVQSRGGERVERPAGMRSAA
jgi:uncharacterized membrane protein